MELSQQSVVITGAASGLGAATARLCAARGARIFLLDQNRDALASIAKETQGKAFACDVTNEQSVQAALADIPTIQVLVNCAGIVQGARMVGKQGPLPLTDFNHVIQVNLIGTFNMMRLVAEKMTQQGPVNATGERGVIVNTASVAAFEGQLGQIAYSASKGGVVAMTLPAARELARFGIRVMSIAPGVMETPMMAGMSETVREDLCADVPFPKQLGDPTQFAALCVHIIENTYLNGSTIRLDGALRMR